MRRLTSEEVDDYFELAAGDESAPAGVAVPLDFRRSDRIPQSQLAVIQLLYEAFVQTLTSSLSLYLRCEFSGAVASIEQLRFSEFAGGLSFPACLVSLTMLPYKGTVAVGMDQSLMAPILDLVLGGNGKIDAALDRELTDIEKEMLEGFFRIVAHDLSAAWKRLAPIDFGFDSVETKPQLSKRIAAPESVVVTAMELNVAERTGKIHVAIPSIVLKTLLPKIDRKPTNPAADSGRMENAIKQRLSTGLKLDIECALVGSTIRLQDLLDLKPGDVIDLGLACDGCAAVSINGTPKFNGELTVEGGKQAVIVRTALE